MKVKTFVAWLIAAMLLGYVSGMLHYSLLTQPEAAPDRPQEVEHDKKFDSATRAGL
jgi:hypothetical protein